ncbi:YcxB family protein [Paenibacillus kobensis]|uniref:YcxB family protein n=1 Tax=Paenibacillus kobensis TaxID=59841 RepID=UPI000FD7B3E7|nr:YcxB family protein [Paenibacillus kobensis]
MHNDVRYPIFRYTLSLEDYRHFNFHHNRTLAVLLLMLYFVLFVGTAFIAGAEGKQSYAVVPMGMLVCSVIGAIMWGSHRWQTWRSFRSNPFIRQEHTIECGSAGMRVLTSSNDLTIRWKEMTKIVEFPRQYAVFIANHQGFVIPKTHVDPGAFRRMLELHIPQDRIKFNA